MRTLLLIVIASLLAQNVISIRILASFHHDKDHHEKHHHHGKKHCSYHHPFLKGANLDAAEELESELLDIIEKISAYPETPQAMQDLITIAATRVSQLMDFEGYEPVKGTGRFFDDTTNSFVKVLQSANEIIPPNERFDEELIASKVRLVETTRQTLRDFLSGLESIAEIPPPKNPDKAAELIHAQQLLIDKTKESYEMVYESAGNILRQVMNSTQVSVPIRKLIAARVLYTAANNLRAFASVRDNVFKFLVKFAKDSNAPIDEEELNQFHHLLKDGLSPNWEEDYEEEDDLNVELTPEEEKELQDLLGDYAHEFM